MRDIELKKITAEIDSLPSGGITYKTINGKKYAYYQWREQGKQHARRVKEDEFLYLSEAIDRRKELQLRLKESDTGSYLAVSGNLGYQFSCPVRLGEELLRFARPVEKWKKRECYSRLHDYIYNDIYDRVFVLYGLRRTGKTTLIRQNLLEMDAEMFEQAAFIQVQDGVTLADINRDIMHLEQAGYRYLFIDEVTLMEDFIGGAALFSDIYAASGMKVVLSGTDSLGFAMAEDEELYDRCIMAHTTFIPYREFENVLGISGIDSYIRYGGTMCVGGMGYNDGIFSSEKSSGEYVDSAIAHNIQHSLKNYKYGTHLGPLIELYNKGELTSAINRVVEDINHRFTIDVLTREWKSSDVRISANNLRKDRECPSEVLDRVSIDEELRALLEILNKPEQSVEINESAANWIHEYMDMLDLTRSVEQRFMSDFNYIEKRTVLTQPGLRYSQADALVKALMNDDVFRDLPRVERDRITERICNEIKGRMMEDIILLETMLAQPENEVFGLKFAAGEFDMVVVHSDEIACDIYEFKHSDKIVPEQYAHLIDENKCKDMEFRYGSIKSKNVVYRGETRNINVDNGDEIKYINVEEYLKAL